MDYIQNPFTLTLKYRLFIKLNVISIYHLFLT